MLHNAHHPIRVLCDSGAESSLIKLSVAVKLGLEIKPTVHSANQADGKSRLTTCGEAHLSFTRGDITLPMEAIILEELGCDVIGGAPFLEQNQIVLEMPWPYFCIFFFLKNGIPREKRVPAENKAYAH